MFNLNYKSMMKFNQLILFSRGTTPARSRAPPTPGIYAATPNRLTRQRSTESKNSSTSEDEYDGVKNAKRCSDEVAVYCRLRPLGESEEVNKIS